MRDHLIKAAGLMLNLQFKDQMDRLQSAWLESRYCLYKESVWQPSKPCNYKTLANISKVWVTVFSTFLLQGKVTPTYKW